MRTSAHSGFTLIELMVVMGLIAILAAISFTSFSQPQTSASLAGIAQTLQTDLRSQQLKAMAGDSISSSSAEPHGIYIEPTKYTLFKGASYSASDTDNFIVSADTGITLSSTLPSGRVIFTKTTGEVSGFSAGANTITITNTISGQAKVLTLNALGVAASN